MGKLTREYCRNCKQITNQEWLIDYDSDPGYPIFLLMCHSCERLEEQY